MNLGVAFFLFPQNAFLELWRFSDSDFKPLSERNDNEYFKAENQSLRLMCGSASS